MSSTTMVNGFSCKNCTDIDYANKHIDPAHPKDGPYGVYAKDKADKPVAAPAVKFGGTLEGLNATASASDAKPKPVDPFSGGLIDLKA